MGTARGLKPYTTVHNDLRGGCVWAIDGSDVTLRIRINPTNNRDYVVAGGSGSRGDLDLVSLGEVSEWWKIEMTINDTDRVSSIVVSSPAPSISMVAVAGRFFGGLALLASARNDAMVVADYRV